MYMYMYMFAYTYTCTCICMYKTKLMMVVFGSLSSVNNKPKCFAMSSGFSRQTHTNTHTHIYKL